VSNRYAPTLLRLYHTYSPKGVRFWRVYPDPHVSVGEIRAHTKTYGYEMAALRDPRRRLTLRAKAAVTPEAAVFTPSGRLVYHGRIDDRFVAFGRARPAPTVNDLKDTLDAVLNGRPVPRPSARAIGCYIQESP
jgi:hypothetical protein